MYWNATLAAYIFTYQMDGFVGLCLHWPFELSRLWSRRIFSHLRNRFILLLLSGHQISLNWKEFLNTSKYSYDFDNEFRIGRNSRFNTGLWTISLKFYCFVFTAKIEAIILLFVIYLSTGPMAKTPAKRSITGLWTMPFFI